MLNAGVWLVGGNFSSQLLRLISNLILTRLLVPEAFGLVATVNTLYFALVMFSDLGVWQSVVKSERGHDPRFLGTAWLLQIMRGGVLAGIVLVLALGLYFGAGAGLFVAGTVYADSRLPAMMAVFALCAIVQSLESMKLAVAQRELHARQLAGLELTAQLAGMAVTIGLAWATRSVWALLLGTLAGGITKAVLSHVAVPGDKIRPCWDQGCAKEIFGFGKWIFMSSIVGFLAAHGEKLILGYSLNAATFGVYSIANNLLTPVTGVYAALNARVIFSSLSLALRSKDAGEFVRAYTRVQQIADIFLGVLAGGLLMSGQWLVWLLYDQRYKDAGWMLQYVSLSLLAMRHQVVEQIMFARGMPALVTANNLLRAGLLAVAIPIGFSLHGTAGAVIGVVISQFASWPLSLRFKYKEGLLNWSTEKWWLPALLAGMAGGWLLDALLSALIR
jgi:O-antigen/teichoic acid export membrane protein